MHGETVKNRITVTLHEDLVECFKNEKYFR